VNVSNFILKINMDSSKSNKDPLLGENQQV